jgi:flavin reductase (DIM6/NTAB) family NADH-FMN oxidoreductase RutF
MSLPAIDATRFRKALGAFPTGVTVVTSIGSQGEPRGFTANSFTSVSLDPPLLLVCVAKSAAGFSVFTGTHHFAINVLAEHQATVSSLFASKRPDKFAHVAWWPGTTGSPLLSDSVAWFDCTTHDRVDAGDHVILIGRVVAFDDSQANPLGYCRGAYLTFGLSQQAVAAAGMRARIGAILEQDGGIVLIDAAAGHLEVPTGTSLESASDPTSLKAILAGLGLRARLNFLFAVFEDARGSGPLSIYYRGTSEGGSSTGGTSTGERSAANPIRIVPLDRVPWDRVADEAVRTMLERFVKERSEDAFGIYIGDSKTGTVHPLAKPA